MFQERGFCSSPQETLITHHELPDDLRSFRCPEGHSHSDRRARDPFLPENRIPLPKFVVKSPAHSFNVIEDFGPIFEISPSSNGRRRNERERLRVRSVNEGFEKLKKYLPREKDFFVNGSKYVGINKKKFSKVDVLRSAILYIQHLQQLLKDTK